MPKSAGHPLHLRPLFPGASLGMAGCGICSRVEEGKGAQGPAPPPPPRVMRVLGSSPQCAAGSTEAGL